MPDQAAQAGIYLYGVTWADGTRVLDVPPISGDGLVYLIARGGLAAVVSDGPLSRYEVSRANVRRHEAVVDSVMQSGDILPTRLGTVLESREAVEQDLLGKRQSELTELLERVRDRVELGLKASWTDLQPVFRNVVAGDRDLRALRDRLTRARGVTYEARIDLGDRAAKALDALRGREADRLVEALRPQAVNVHRGEPVSELMVLNAAFLVDRGRAEEFEVSVRDLDHAHAGSLIFRLAGPLPPYNFVSLSGP